MKRNIKLICIGVAFILISAVFKGVFKVEVDLEALNSFLESLCMSLGASYITLITNTYVK